MKDLYELSLFDITPSNIAQDKIVSNIIKAIDPQFMLLSKDIQANLLLPRIDELDEKSLDLLAWQLHTDFYDLAGNIKMKREAVKNSLIWHMKKGTEWAIHEALRQLGISAKFHPWWETGGEPYTFTLDAIVTDDYYRTAPGNKITENIRRAVDEAKAARSYLAGLTTKIEFNDDAQIFIAHADLLSGSHRIFPEKPKAPVPEKFYMALAAYVQGDHKIFTEKLNVKPGEFFIAHVTHEFIDAEFGVDLHTMHELLLMFEQRIFARFDEHERKLQLELEERNRELKAEIESLRDMLKWRDE